MNKISLREIAKYISRGISPRYVDSGGILTLNQKCIRNNKIDTKMGRLTDSNKGINPHKMLQKMDILINSTGIGTLGRVAQLRFKTEATVDSHVTILRLADTVRGSEKRVVSLYVGYCIRAQEKLIESLGTGATGQTELSKDSLLDSVLISLPELSVQTTIAALLLAYDDLIENNEKRIKALEEMTQLLYTEWFVKFKFPGHEKVKMVQSGTKYGVIPEGWEVVRFRDKIELAYGKALKEENRRTGRILVYGSSGLVGTHDEKLVAGPGIVVGRKGNAGTVFWVDSDFYPIDTTFFVRTKLPLTFVFYLLKDQNFIVGDAAVPGVNREQTYRNEILVPKLELVNSFTEHVEPIKELISKIGNQNKRLSQMRDLLIPQLVTGHRLLKVEDKLILKRDLFRDAVVFAYFIKSVASATFTPTHLRAVKSIYFADRFFGVDPTLKYAEQTFGPYDPKSRYGGGESIAVKKKYVQRVRGGFTIGPKISEIANYSYDEVYSVDKVLAHLRYKKDKDLELLATVDFILYKKLKSGEKPTPESVFNYIKESPIWKQKVARLGLSIEKVSEAISSLEKLKKEGLTYPN